MILENISKKPNDYQPLEEPLDLKRPEEFCNFWNLVTFSWLSPLMKLGYKNQTLTLEDLNDIEKHHYAENVSMIFQTQWNKELKKNNPSLFKAIVRSFGGPFCFSGLFKLGQDILQFIQPILMSLLISFIQEWYSTSNTDAKPEKDRGYLIAILMLITAITQSCLLHQYYQQSWLPGMNIRAALITAIYQKSLKLSTKSKQKHTTGEIVNYMSVDAQRFMDLTAHLHDVWSCPFQIILALYLLYQTLGLAIFAGVGVLILMIPINSYLANRMRKLQKLQMNNKDQRMKIIDETLNGIKIIKLYSWEKTFMERIGLIRDKELNTLKSIGILSAIQTFSFTCTPVLVSFATFTLYSLLSKEPLTPQKVFVSISLFNMLQFPLSMFPFIISSVVEASVSVNRLQKFMINEEIRDYSRSQSSYMNSDLALELKGSFFWENEVVLKDISFQIPNQTLVAVIGKVGSGKSSLLSAILGEMYAGPNSFVYKKGKVALVSQQSWIMNASLRENILFGSPYQPEEYQKVLDVCGLRMDIEILPYKDQTEIGERGINLSGGQKQRVALARAVYANADIYLLDDCLSAVDPHLGKHIFNNVIGPQGLLKNKTRIFVTHQLQYLAQCDFILKLDDGKMSPPGLIPFSQFNDSVENIFIEKVGAPIDSKATTLTDLTISPTILKPNSQIIQKEEMAQGSVDWKIYKSYAKSSSLKGVLFSMLLMILAQVCNVLSNLWLKQWSTAADRNEEPNVALYLVVYGTIGLSYAILVVIQVIIFFSICALSTSKVLHQEILDSILKSPMNFFDTTPIGRIMNRFSKDIYTIDEALPRYFQSFFRTFFNVVTVLFVISFSTPLFLILIVPLLILYYFIQNYYIPSSRSLKRLDSLTKSPIFAHFSETLSGVSTIRAFDKQIEFQKENETRLDWNQRAYYPSISCNRWLGMRLELIGAMIIFGSALFSVLGVVYFGNIDAGLAGLSISYALTVTQTLNWMVRQSCEIETNIVSVERVQEYIELPKENTTKVPLKNWPQTGDIKFVNYSSRYRAGMDLVLKNLNFTITSGQKVGIVGRSGAGKSSLVLALFRLIEPAEGGTIMISNEDIKKIPLSQLRSSLTIIPQDPFLFGGTLRDNLDPFHQYDDIALWQSLKSARLDEKVKRMNGQLEAVIAQGGENFSVGERQLFCLVRALLRRSKILICDEATAAIDFETDAIIQETIRREFKQQTVITIAHRINTILDSDWILFLDQGQVVEMGDPKQLLRNSDSKFYQLAREMNLH